MCTKLFHRLPYLLCLFQISCFVAWQRIPLHSSSFSGCSNEHKKVDVVCNSHLGGLGIEPKNFGNELLVYGFIREFEPKVANKIIPDCIMNLCVDFSKRMLPCDCIKGKYRKILPNKDLKKALIFFLIYKIEDVRDQKSKAKKNILHYACGNGNLELAKLLRQQGANIYAKDKNEDNALHWACWSSGSVEMVTWLLDECKIGIETKGYWERTSFLLAAQKGNLRLAKRLKERGANINSKDKDGNNALHLACLFSGSVAMVEWLSDVCKIDKETKGLFERTPFLCAAKKGQLEIAKLLRQRGTNIHATDKYGNNALHLACYKDSVPMATWLLDECKLGLETKEELYEMTPFLCATEKGHLAIAKLLRKRGANINAKDEDESNALHLACFFSGSVEMTTWLLDECHIGLETKGFAQRTPFLCAAEKGQLAIAKLLKKQNANLNAKDKNGRNALWWAKNNKHKAMINYLEEELGLK